MNENRLKQTDRLQDCLLTLREVANILRLGRVTTLRLVQTSKLKAFKAGRAWRIRREDLERFMRPPIVVEQETARLLASLAPGPKILGKKGTT